MNCTESQFIAHMKLIMLNFYSEGEVAFIVGMYNTSKLAEIVALECFKHRQIDDAVAVYLKLLDEHGRVDFLPET